MTKWYEKESWSEEVHQAFYERYLEVDPEEQEEAILVQARLWSETQHEETLKAAESLMLEWFAHHRNSRRSDEAHVLVVKLCDALGKEDQAYRLMEELKRLKRE